MRDNNKTGAHESQHAAKPKYIDLDKPRQIERQLDCCQDPAPPTHIPAFVLRWCCTKPPTVKIIEPALIRYCPFEAKVSLSADSSSLDVAFSFKSANPGPHPLGVHRRYVRVQLDFDKTTYAYTINEVEYIPESEKSVPGKIETRLVWEHDSGPTRFTSITLSFTSGAQIAINTAYAGGATCNSDDDLILNLLTSFEEAEVARIPEANLKLRAKLHWRNRIDEGICIDHSDCRSVDVGGLPSWPDSCVFP